MSPRRGSFLRSGGSRGPFVLAAIAVVVLILVDVVLVSVALGRTRAGDHGTPGPIPTFSSTPTPVPTPTASATPAAPVTPGSASTASTSGASDVVGTARHLVVVSATEAWRASSGVCTDDTTSLEHSTDGGATWTAVPISGDDVRTIGALSATSARVSVLAGLGGACTPTGLSTYTSGKFWAKDTTPATGAAISSTGSLVLTGGTVASPCANPVQVVQGATATAVVCSTGLAWRTGTSGTWVTVPLAGLRAVAINGASYTLARTGVSGCSGVQVSRLAAAGVTVTAKPTVLGCAPATATSGPVALGQTGSSVWVWSGAQTLVSGDGGSSW